MTHLTQSAWLAAVLFAPPAWADDDEPTSGTVLDADFLQALPIGRSLPGILELAPGVSARIDTSTGVAGGGRAVARGEGQYGNDYLLDGVSVRDPTTKLLRFGINFDALERVGVVTDGMTADHGRATGMIADIRTRSGGDEHHGSAGYWFDTTASARTPPLLILGEVVPTGRPRSTGHELSLTAGGPVVREKLWYFAAAQLRNEARWRGEGDPDRARGGQGFGKLTWFATPELRLQLQSGVELGSTRVPLDRYSAVGEAAALPKRVETATTHRVAARWRPTDTVTVRLIGAALDGVSEQLPATLDPGEPRIYDVDTGKYVNNWGRWHTTTTSRVGGAARLTLQGLGRYTDAIELGADLWRVGQSTEITRSGVAPSAPGFDEEGEEIHWRDEGYTYFRKASEGFPCTPAAGYADCLQVTEHDSLGRIGNRGTEHSAFVRGRWTFFGVVTVDAGVRVDGEVLRDNAEVPEVVYSSLVAAPRLAVGWDLTGDGRTRLSGSLGRHYDVQGLSLSAWTNTRVPETQHEYYNVGDRYTRAWLSEPSSSPLILCTPDSLASLAEDPRPRLEAGARAACGDRSLRPYHVDELVLGFERELAPGLTIGIKGITTRTRDLPEDVDWDLVAWVVTNPENKRRDYRAVELVVQRAFDEHFQLLASYTLSSSRGHMPGQLEASSQGGSGSSGNGVGVYMDDIYDQATRAAHAASGRGWLLDGLAGLGTIDNTAGHYGYLPGHSFHVIELAARAKAPWGSQLGVVYGFDSGHAWQKRGLVPLYGDYFAFPAGRGTRFMPAMHSLDLRISHAVELGHDTRVELSVDAFNVLDSAAPISMYQNDNAHFGMVMARQAPRGLRLGGRFSY